MDRRSLMKSALLMFAGGHLSFNDWLSIGLAEAGETHSGWRHGISKLVDLKYPAEFKRFDYVNSNAPKGGAASQIALGAYDNFNMVVAGIKGTLRWREMSIPSSAKASIAWALGGCPG